MKALDLFKADELNTKCEVKETDTEYLINLDTYGIPKEKVKVVLTDDTLVVTGEHLEEHKEKNKKQRIEERCESRFERSFTLPDVKKGAGVQTKFKNGLLRIAVAKQAA